MYIRTRTCNPEPLKDLVQIHLSHNLPVNISRFKNEKLKAIFLCIGIVSSIGPFDDRNLDLEQELLDKMILDLSEVELHDAFQDYVTVHFTICDQQIEIQSIGGSNQEVVEAVQDKMQKLQIDANYQEDKLYNFKFTFEKQ